MQLTKPQLAILIECSQSENGRIWASQTYKRSIDVLLRNGLVSSVSSAVIELTIKGFWQLPIEARVTAKFMPQDPDEHI